jgi:uncharacterized protein DUF6484
MDDREPRRTVLELAEAAESRDFEELIRSEIGEETLPARRIDGVVVGTLVGFTDNGATPLVTYRDQPGIPALPARTTVDLHGPHIGRAAVLMFEEGDPCRPIIVGCIRHPGDRSLPRLPGQVEVDADGERLVVSANQGLVLRCGKASITLSPEGKVVIRGTQVVSHASGLNRIKGGSVQVN